MCEPATMFLISTGLTIYQSEQMKQQGRYEAAVGEYKQGIHEYRARVTENDAERVRKVGLDEELAQREKTAQILSQQRAQLGAAGVDVSAGSAAALQVDTETLGEADALRIRTTTGEQAQVLTEQAGFERSMGEFELEAGKQRQKQLNTKAAVNLIGGTVLNLATSGVASKWFTPQSAGVASGALASPTVDPFSLSL